MLCPFCGHPDQKVLESRDAREGSAVRRRRECLRCERRFTTFETWERGGLFVIKRDGARQEFDRGKLLHSMVLACGKRPVSVHTLESTAEEIERELFHEFESEVPTTVVGERVMQALQAIDTVAYVRYASVYREFETIGDFSKVLRTVKSGSSSS